MSRAASKSAPDLSKARYYRTLAAKEHRRSDKLKFHDRAMAEMFRALGWGEYPRHNPQGRLV